MNVPHGEKYVFSGQTLENTVSLRSWKKWIYYLSSERGQVGKQRGMACQIEFSAANPSTGRICFLTLHILAGLALALTNRWHCVASIAWTSRDLAKSTFTLLECCPETTRQGSEAGLREERISSGREPRCPNGHPEPKAREMWESTLTLQALSSLQVNKTDEWALVKPV